MDKYRIEFSNRSKTPIEVGYRSFNSDTSLTLPGKNTVNYGKDLNSCFYHLLESFCNDLPPINAIEGQTWYDTANKKLKVYDGAFWMEVGRSNQPIIPDDAATPALVLLMTDKYLRSDGGDMLGKLLLKPTSSGDSDNAAVTKKYVDTIQPSQIGDMIPLFGNAAVPTGSITGNRVVVQPNQAVTKAYADDNVRHIIKTIDQPLTITSGSATGRINTVTLKPSNQIYIFGNADLPTTSAFIDILLDVTDITNECVLVNATGTLDATVDISAYVTTNSKSETVLRIIKHTTLTKAISVNFTVSGEIA